MTQEAYEEAEYKQQKAWEEEQEHLDSLSAEAIANAEAEEAGMTQEEVMEHVIYKIQEVFIADRKHSESSRIRAKQILSIPIDGKTIKELIEDWSSGKLRELDPELREKIRNFEEKVRSHQNNWATCPSWKVDKARREILAHIDAYIEAKVEEAKREERERIMKIFASFGKIKLDKPLSGKEFEALFD